VFHSKEPIMTMPRDCYQWVSYFGESTKVHTADCTLGFDDVKTLI